MRILHVLPMIDEIVDKDFALFLRMTIQLFVKNMRFHKELEILARG